MLTGDWKFSSSKEQNFDSSIFNELRHILRVKRRL
jgi:hypothetical protein